MQLYLPSGQSEPVPLHDNTYLVEAPAVDYPVRLVAYDNHELVIGIITLQAQTPPPGFNPSPRPITNAHWHQILNNSAGTVSIAPSTTGGTCYAIARSPHGGGVDGGSFSCPTPLPPTGLNLGLAWSKSSGTTANVRAGKRIAQVVIHYKNGQRQTVRIIDGIGLAEVPPADIVGTAFFRGITTLVGLDPNGRVIATQNVFSLIGGSGTISKLTPASITIGAATCRISNASPALTGYHPGIKVQYLCHQGLLTLIGRSKPGHGWNSRTVLIRGPIVALNPGSITLSDTDATTTSNPAPKRTCKLTPASPSTSRYRPQERVQVYCAGGTLTGINHAN
jgi:hypothetical protein